jgi:hypothetical protein
VAAEHRGYQVCPYLGFNKEESCPPVVGAFSMDRGSPPVGNARDQAGGVTAARIGTLLRWATDLINSRTRVTA